MPGYKMDLKKWTECGLILLCCARQQKMKKKSTLIGIEHFRVDMHVTQKENK